ncbi:hypothetical protein FA15DRAFT_548819, partial [Coprinopsis marcescibilis]
IWLGDFNQHSPLWDEERNSHLFTGSNNTLTEPLLRMTEHHEMEMALPKDIPTLRALNTKNLTWVDNVFVMGDLMDQVISCDTLP